MAVVSIVLFPIAAVANCSPHLRHDGDHPRDVPRPRQAVIAVLDHGQHHVVDRQPVSQRKRMLPRHVGILRALQDMHRAADLDGAAEQQMAAALFDQRARDRIRLAIGRRPQPHTLGFDLLTNLRRKTFPHQRFGKVRRRRDQHQSGERRTVAGPPRHFARQ
jgi:hypothetical protein